MMMIKRLTIKNFGRIHDRTMEFSPGINVLYGENESGKTTVHTFLKSMFYGIRRQRGRAAKTDLYSTYEPWENPSAFGGTMWFENAGRSFRLTRNFYKTDCSSELICEDDGEVLDVERGDLDAILGGVSEAVFENTVSVGQLKSVTGPDLVKELQNYMASYQGTADYSVDLGRTMQMLKMWRKGYSVQIEKQKKETEKEQDKISVNMDYLRQEMEELEEKKASVSSMEKSLHMHEEEDGGAILEERIGRIRKKRVMLAALTVLLLLLAGGGIVAASGMITNMPVLRVMISAAGIIAVLVSLVEQKRLGEELYRRKRMKERWLKKQEKLHWNMENLEEACREKEMALSNLAAEYRDTEEHAYLPMAEETEIEALNLAMSTIEALSGNIHSQVGIKLRRRTSRILSEITGGKYGDILMDKEFHMMVNTPERLVPLESLSRGTLEQVYFALRMAAGELLCKGECFPVILDDVFGMYDEERLAAVLHWLAGEKRQILISTCHKREMEILEREGIPYQKLVL